MNGILQDLLDHLTLERLEENLFRGQSRDIGSPNAAQGRGFSRGEAVWPRGHSGGFRGPGGDDPQELISSAWVAGAGRDCRGLPGKHPAHIMLWTERLSLGVDLLQEPVFALFGSAQSPA